MTDAVKTINRFDVNQFAERLESFKAEIYWSSLSPPANIQDILKEVCNQSCLRNLSPQDLSEYATLLAAYSTYLTGQENRLSSYINWCETNIKYLVGKQLQDAPGYGYPEKDCFIRANDANAADLELKKLEASVKLDSIKYLSQKISFLSDSVRNLAFEKRKSFNV